jgi:hypothetical protein
MVKPKTAIVCSPIVPLWRKKFIPPREDTPRLGALLPTTRGRVGFELASSKSEYASRVTSFPARRLIVLYATLAVLVDVSVLLPGNPYYSSVWGFVGAVVFQALIVWRLWHSSPIAWLFGLLSALLMVASIYLMSASAEVGTVLLTFFSLAQAGILAAPPLATFVWWRRERPVSSA